MLLLSLYLMCHALEGEKIQVTPSASNCRCKSQKAEGNIHHKSKEVLLTPRPSHLHILIFSLYGCKKTPSNRKLATKSHKLAEVGKETFQAEEASV